MSSSSSSDLTEIPINVKKDHIQLECSDSSNFSVSDESETSSGYDFTISSDSM